ncbi:MAG: T9SS type A sorting domain-containing protein [Bacteroidales bacterium]|nr:T9SS type A sorting domain-containing protein [Bacteroidales bacterium]
MKKIINIVIITIVLTITYGNLSAQTLCDTLENKLIRKTFFSQEEQEGYGFFRSYNGRFAKNWLENDHENIYFTASRAARVYADSISSGTFERETNLNVFFRIDKDLNVIDSSRELTDAYANYKIGETFYSFGKDTNCNEYVMYKRNFQATYLDSIHFGKLTYWRNLPGHEFPSYHYCTEVELTSDTCFVIVNKVPYEDTMWLCELQKIDTNGNLLATNTINIHCGDYSQRNEHYNTAFRCGFYTNKGDMEIDVYSTFFEWLFERGPLVSYHIDNNTLQVTDTFLYPEKDSVLQFMFNRLMINDSIGVTTNTATGLQYPDSIVLKIAIIDTKHCVVLDTINIRTMGNCHSREDGKKPTPFNFTNPDSIYLVLSEETDPNSNKNALIIVNFSINGTLNFVQRFSDVSYEHIDDIFATNDGGIIIAGHMFDKNYDYEDPLRWTERIMKYMPNGVVSLQTLDKEDIFTLVYPNPAKDIINISSSEQINEVEIINFAGQIVYSSKEKSKNLTINTQNFEKGNYLVQIQTDKGLSTKKIVIE